MEKDINKRKPVNIDGIDFIPVKHSEMFNRYGMPIHGFGYYWSPELHISSMNNKDIEKKSIDE